MISVGPLALALERLFAVLGIIAFIVAASWIGRRHGTDVEKAAWRALLVGFVAARLGFVAQNWPAFAVEPLTVLYVWQGGFSPLIGLVSAGVALAVWLRRSRALLPMGLAFIACAGCALAATALFVASAQRPLPRGIVLQSMDGVTSSLDDRMGKPFVINLWATWCPPCQREMPMMVAEAARSPVPILLVNQGEYAAKVQAWLDSKHLGSANVHLDPDQNAAGAIGSPGLPTTLFVDSKGVIRVLHVGEISRATLLAELQDLE